MAKADYNGVLIFAEQIDGIIQPISYELLNKARELADQLQTTVSAALLGPAEIKAEELIYHGADRVYYLINDIFKEPLEFQYQENLLNLIDDIKPEIILFGASSFGRSLAPRISAALKTGLTADCTGLEIDENGKLVQIRPAFSENILAHISTKTLPQIATIRYKEFPEGRRDESREGEIIEKEAVVLEEKGVQLLEKLTENKVNISDAEVIVAGGRGLKSAEDFKLLQKLADLFAGTIAASRDLVDEGFVSREYQVGYSGSRVKPKIYFACGISGAPQHIAGMKDSDIIVAINNNPSAPIFNIADYAIIGDLYKVIPELCEKISNASKEGS
ncbi:electron transfer flavoprotein subunit alpha/FixB family protein [Natronospora cellulosivora (SeqCode)]